VAAFELPVLRRVAYAGVLAQAVLTAVIALVCYARWGRNAGLSAAIGGGIGTAASLTLVLIALRNGTRELADIVRAFYIGEAAKIAVMVLLFVVVLSTLRSVLVPSALFGAYVATFIVHWVALKRAMPKLDGA
jgi:F0F1-type ATP synthase assembly protein I